MKSKIGSLRSLRFTLTFLVLLVFLSLDLFATDFEIEKHDDQTCTIVGYTGNDEVLIIPSVVEGYRVKSIGEWAFKFQLKLKNITIPASVTSIGNRAFADCISLSTIMVDPKNPTFAQIQGILFDKKEKMLHTYPAGKETPVYFVPDGILAIGYGAFANCSSLTSIIIPDSVTSIGKGAFRGCESLTSISIPDSVTSIGSSAFSICSSLKSINIPDSITSIGEGAFWGCESLTSISIPDSVTSIGGLAFLGCSSLATITVDLKNPTFEQIQGILFDKKEKILHTYPAGKETPVYSIPDGIVTIGDYAFFGCESLTSISIPDSVRAIGYSAFFRCNSLTSINIPDSVTSIGVAAFADCKSLTSITIPDSVTSIGDYAFAGCDLLSEIHVTENSYAYEFFLDTEYAPLISYRPSWL